jgi:uncharacterized protein (DUF885 family)
MPADVRVLALALILAAGVGMRFAPARGSAASPNPTLQALFDEAWAFRLAEDPLFATSAGEHKYDDRLPSATRADWNRRAEFSRTMLQRLAAIDRAGLAPADRISDDMLSRQLSDTVADVEFGAWRIPLNADSGFHTDFADLPDRAPFVTVRDYENYVARLRAFPRWVDEEIGAMREGLKAGFTLPRVVLQGIDVTMTTHRGLAGEERLLRPVPPFPVGVPDAERARLTDAGRAAIRGRRRRGIPRARRLHEA